MTTGDGQPAPPGKNDPFRGLQGVDLKSFTNVALNGQITAPPTRGAQGFSVPTVDPGEKFDSVTTQIFGDPAGLTPNMSGVVADFVQVLQDLKYTDDQIKVLAPQVMESFTPSQLPVLNQLAKAYAVCDDWFASVPSQTNPNRAFLMCGTSMGMASNGFLEKDPRRTLPRAFVRGAARRRPSRGHDNLQRAGRRRRRLDGLLADRLPADQDAQVLADLTALAAFFGALSPLPGVGKIAAAALSGLGVLQKLDSTGMAYLMEGLSAADLNSNYTHRLFPYIQKIPDADSHFHRLSDFHAQARAGTLPAFSFIEPEWSISRTTTDNGVFARLMSSLGNDYHPPATTWSGRSSSSRYTRASSRTRRPGTRRCWSSRSTSSSAPSTTSPHTSRRSRQRRRGQQDRRHRAREGFPFDRFGARVPAILVSPWIEAGTVFRSNEDVPSTTPRSSTPR